MYINLLGEQSQPNFWSVLLCIHRAPQPHSYNLSLKKSVQQVCIKYPTWGRQFLRGEDKAYFMLSTAFPLLWEETVEELGERHRQGLNQTHITGRPTTR